MDGLDMGICLWSVSNGKSFYDLKYLQRSVLDFALSADGRLLASAGDYEENSIQLWSLGGRRRLRRFFEEAPRVACSISFSPDGKVLAGTSVDGVQLWDVKTGKRVGYLNHPQRSGPKATFSPDWRTCACWGAERISLCDVNTGEVVHTLEGHAGRVHSVAFCPFSGGKVLASGSEDETIRIWDTDTGQELRRLIGHAGPVRSVAFSPQHRVLASGGADRSLRLWDLDTGQEYWRLEGYEHEVSDLAFSPDGKILASTGQRSRVVLLDLAGNKRLRQTDAVLGDIWGPLVFTPDGATLLGAFRWWPVSPPCEVVVH